MKVIINNFIQERKKDLFYRGILLKLAIIRSIKFLINSVSKFAFLLEIILIESGHFFFKRFIV